MSPPPDAPPPLQDLFVWLDETGTNKVRLIKYLGEVMGLHDNQVFEWMKNTPCRLMMLDSVAEGDEICARLKALGARARVMRRVKAATRPTYGGKEDPASRYGLDVHDPRRYNIILEDAGPRRLGVLNILRRAGGNVDSGRQVLDGGAHAIVLAAIDRQRADDVASQLEAAGARVAIQGTQG